MKDTNSTNSTPTPATTPTATATPETTTPEKVTTVNAMKLLKQRNSDRAKTARERAVDALLRLYKDDPVRALVETDHRENRNETPYLTEYEYQVDSVDSDGNVTTDTEKGFVRFDALFFAPRANKREIGKLFDQVGRTATAKPERPTAQDGRKHVDDVREIVRLCGFGQLSPSVNHTTVVNIMNDARFTTGKGNRQFDTARAKLSLFGFLWSTANKYQTTSAYTRDQDAKKARAEQRKAERTEQRKKNKPAKQGKPANKPATPAK